MIRLGCDVKSWVSVAGTAITSGDWEEPILGTTTSLIGSHVHVNACPPPYWNNLQCWRGKKRLLRVIFACSSPGFRMGIFSNTSTFDGLVGKFFVSCSEDGNKKKAQLMSAMWRKTNVHEDLNFAVLDKSTSQLLLEPDWNSILLICDCIRQEDVK